MLRHETGSHPENPGRLGAVRSLLIRCGLWDRLPRPPVEAAPRASLLDIHTEPYLEALEQICAAGGGYLTGDTPIGPHSFTAASYASGAAMAAVDAAMEGASGSFALVRPPGHHAGRDYGMGFCLLNHAAVAARHAVRRWGLERVLILDFDVHHGNGTQDIFYEDSSVFYLSMHQSPAYPGTGLRTEQGAGAGRGSTLNLPLPPGSGDEEHFAALQPALLQAAESWRPQLILCSAGYDSHFTNCRYVSGIRMQVTVAGFVRWIELIRDVARQTCAGRLCFTLEGGYDPEALAESVAATLFVMLDEEPVMGTAPPGDGRSL